MKNAFMLILGLFLGYVAYLHFPQQFEIGQCFTENQTKELYRVVTKSARDLSFKDRWVFGPMKMQAELIKVNPNTLRISGERRFFYPSSDSLLLTECNKL